MGRITVRPHRRCRFCQEGKRELDEKLFHKLPSKHNGGKSVRCDRVIYSDKYCVAALAPEQCTDGHTLLILRKHKTDITSRINKEELGGFITVIHKLAIHLKHNAKNDWGCRPKRIYVCFLSDGVKHLHAHLVPRYPFTPEDREKYIRQFVRRDGVEIVKKAKRSNDLGGFWYIAERERSYNKTEFWEKSDEERAKCLQDYAKNLKLAKLK